MPITSKAFTPVRPRVLVVGDIDPTELQSATKAFRRRGYQLELVSRNDLVDQARSADSVVLLPSIKRRGEQAATLVQFGSTLLDLDCRIYVRPPKPDPIRPSQILRALAESGLPAGYVDAAYSVLPNEPQTPRVEVLSSGTPWWEISQLVAQHPAGPSPNGDLEIVGTSLSAAEETLIRRAFHDCNRVELVAMAEGLSGVSAYRAFATVGEGMLGPSPYPYFVKVGSRSKIATEVDKYRGNALAYVPFHLGPRLIERRCGLGATSGILVCDLVSDCLCLKDCATFAGVSAIASLFNRTLKTWHDTSREDVGSLAGALAPRLMRRPVIPEDRHEIAKSLGARNDYATLRQAFERRGRSEMVRLGAIHGDLHATNVMVRGFDAVLIDFESQQNDQPLLFDPASLEAGLLVDGFSREDRSTADILASIRPLYTGDLLGWRAPPEAATQSEWFYDCVRQIRLHARHLESAPNQYTTALACTLLGKAANAHKDLAKDEHKNRMRAVAYVLADLILIPPSSCP